MIKSLLRNALFSGRYLFYIVSLQCITAFITLAHDFSPSTVRAVNGTITSSEDGSPMPGVNIVIKGTSVGTTSDGSGNYTIDVPSDNDILVFSFIGFLTQEVLVGTQSTVNVQMQLDVATLAEVVVIGYGEVDVKDATGSIVALKAEDFNQGVIVSPEQLMQGKVAGVQITTTTGEPGAANNLRIRGASSIISGSNPLYVVDGLPLSNDDTQSVGLNGGIGQSAPRNPLNFLNPGDIADMVVLKDASATAIYGSRGANGVVIITTKKASQGKPLLNYSFNAGFSKISRKYDLLGREGFLDGYAQYNGSSDAIDNDANTDWQDQVFRTAFTQTHNLSYGAGDLGGSYLFSVSYMDQEGIIESSGMKRFTARFNGEKKFINDKLTLGTQFTVAQIEDDQVPVTTNSGFEGDLMGNVLKANPTSPIYNDDGTFFQLSNTEANPVAMISLSNALTNTTRVLAGLYGEYQLTKNLKFRTVYGFDQSTSIRRAAFSRLLNITQVYNLGRLYLNNVELRNNLWENYLTYDKNFGSINFNGLVGYSYQSFENASQDFELSHFRTDDLDIMMNNYASADQSVRGSAAGRNSSNTKDELQSYYVRVNLGLGERFLLTATLRADGSTRFGGNNKYGYFPSGAFKWRLDNESFIPDVFSTLSWRVSYGITGNQQIPHNLYTDRVRFANWTINGPADNLEGGGLAPVAVDNPNLQWESTTQFNTGIDFGLFNQKLRGSLDYYHKNTSEMLAVVNRAQPDANSFRYENLDGNVINEGFEIVLDADPIDKTDFRWAIQFNAAYNFNEVRNLNTFYNTGEINGQGLSGAYAQRIADGQPLFAYYVREFDGFDENGIAQYEGGDVQKFVGKAPLPKWSLGLGNTFYFKHFDFNFFFTGQFGQYVYSNTENAFFTAGSLANGRNVSPDVPNTDESPLNAPDVSTRFLHDASFIRLQNATLGYNLAINSTAISSLRFTITGQNLFVITDYPFQDPEVSITKAQTLARDTPNILNFGIDYTAYPKSRTLTIGISAIF